MKINFFKRILFYFILSMLLVSRISLSMNNGIVFDGTRIIYPESEKNGVTFNITNNTERTYLLQSRVTSWYEDKNENGIIYDDNISNIPFIVVPPLSRFEPMEKITLHIRMINDILPKDRESVFSLSIKSIPNQERKVNEKRKLTLALQNNIKLFYRPNDLIKMNSASRLKSLKFEVTKNELVVKNPTPYYITLSELKVGDVNLLNAGERMIAPFDEKSYSFKLVPNIVVKWKIIDDDGRLSDVAERKIKI